jgi:hypothetical protein
MWARRLIDPSTTLKRGPGDPPRTGPLLGEATTKMACFDTLSMHLIDHAVLQKRISHHTTSEASRAATRRPVYLGGAFD